MRLLYEYSTQSNWERERLDYEVLLEPTKCHFGGVRWWFLCPMMKDTARCGRRCGVLYFAGRYAGCRLCYDLTYESCQESHKFDLLAGKMNPYSISRLLKRARKEARSGKVLNA
jgi:hypothetical protein